MHRFWVVFCGVLVCILASYASASELVSTTDMRRVLVNKDVGGDRWAITYDRDRSAVTGNVLRGDGTATFLDCKIGVPANDELQLDCSSAGGDGAWASLGAVSVPLSFFGISNSQCDSVATPGAYPSWTLSVKDSCDLAASAILGFTQNICQADGWTQEGTDPRMNGVHVSTTIEATGGVSVQIDFAGLCSGTVTGHLERLRADPYYGRFEFGGDVSGSTSCCPGFAGRATLAEGYD
jgi:hypothetical protein